MNICQKYFSLSMLIVFSLVSGMDLETQPNVPQPVLDIVPTICAQADRFFTVLNFSSTCKAIYSRISQNMPRIVAENPILISSLSGHCYNKILQLTQQNPEHPLAPAVTQCHKHTRTLNVQLINDRYLIADLSHLIGIGNCNFKSENSRDPYYQTPLFHAICDRGSVDEIALAIECGAEINTVNKYGQTPLFISCTSETPAITSLLLENNANVNVVDEDGETPLFMACTNGNIQTTALLINAGANVNISNNKGETALFNPCENGYVEIVNLLLESGADINAVNEDGETALFKACANRSVKIVKLLIDKRININAVNKENETVLFSACRLPSNTQKLIYEKVQIISYLVENSIDNSIRNNEGKLAVDYYSRKASDNQTVATLDPAQQTANKPEEH